MGRGYGSNAELWELVHTTDHGGRAGEIAAALDIVSVRLTDDTEDSKDERWKESFLLPSLKTRLSEIRSVAYELEKFIKQHD